MTVLLDTGVLVAWMNVQDPLHAAAAATMRAALGGSHGQPLATDTVLDEGLTFLRRRPGRRDVSERFAGLFFPRRALGIDWTVTDEETSAAAKRLHFRHYERGLSFTDCTLLAHAERLDAKVATFGAAFQGLVETVSMPVPVS